MGAVSDAFRPTEAGQVKPFLIFGLDGTLIDSRLDLANSVNATRDHLGMPPLSNQTVYTYVGNGVAVLIKRALGEGAPDQTLAVAQQFFLDYYRRHMGSASRRERGE